MTTLLRCRWCGHPGGERADCAGCGRSASVTARNHVEVDLGIAAGVSDRGHARGRNEDALFLATPGHRAIAAVVCDGVGMAADGDIAAQVAADTAGRALLDVVSGFSDRLVAGTSRAIGAAAAAVAALPRVGDRGVPAPASTLVCVACRRTEVAIGSVGDSRAYWLGPDGARVLTQDDTWAHYEAQAGRLSAGEIAADPRSEDIVSWIGAGTPLRRPHITVLRPREPGLVIICSDGLWRHLPTVSDLVSVVADSGIMPPALRAARALTRLALAAGGQDNVTVAVIAWRPDPEVSDE